MTEATSTPDERASDRILTVPNVLSIIRLLALPLFVYLVLVAHADGWALTLLIISSITDWADGKLARLLNQMSRLGALLDPFVDRLYVATTLLVLATRDIVPWWIVAILVGREVVLAPTLAVYRRRGLPPPEVLYLGKGATFLLMCALPLMLMAVAVPSIDRVAEPLGWAALLWGTALYVWTGVLYLAQAIAISRTVPAGAERPRP